VRRRRAHADLRAERGALRARRRGERKRRGAELRAHAVFRLQPEHGDAFAHFADLQRLHRGADHFESRRRRDGHDHRCIGTRARHIVGDADADVELIAGRHHGRHVWRQHEVAAHERRPLRGADRGLADRHGHDAHAPAEGVRHGVGEFVIALDVDDA